MPTEMMIFRNSIQNGTDFFLSMTEIPSGDILEGLYKLRIRGSEFLRPYWNCMIWRFIRRKQDLIIQIEDDGEKKYRARFYETGILKPETEIMKETLWSRIRGQNRVDKELLEIVGNGSPTGSVLEETIAVSATISISVQK